MASPLTSPISAARAILTPMAMISSGQMVDITLMMLSGVTSVGRNRAKTAMKTSDRFRMKWSDRNRSAAQKVG